MHLCVAGIEPEMSLSPTSSSWSLMNFPCNVRMCFVLQSYFIKEEIDRTEVVYIIKHDYLAVF